jgi:Na+-translocating ferredoxin:NAD+ oxidoreductase RnfE subunit
MANEDKGGSAAAWTAFAGLTPLYVFSSSLSIGMALGWTFLLVYAASSALALLLPAAMGRKRIFIFALAASSVACSLSASFIRIIDPFLFESTYRRLFLVAFTVPVLKSALMPETIADRERAWENVIRGLGYAATIVVFGALREFMASGSISIIAEHVSTSLLPMMAQPAGAMVLLALSMAGFRLALTLARGADR